MNKVDNLEKLYDLIGTFIVVMVVIGSVLIILVVAESLYDRYKLRRTNERMNGIRTHGARTDNTEPS